MQWEGREESENVEDRRGIGGRAIAAGGLGTVLLVVLALVFGVDPRQLVDLTGVNPDQQPNGQEVRPADPQEERLAHFTKVIFHDTEVVWDELFRKMDKQ